LCIFPARQSCCSLASLLLLKGQRDDAFGGAFTHALVRSSSASDFGFRRREEEGGTIESETYRLEGERQILSCASFELRMLGLFAGDQVIGCVFSFGGICVVSEHKSSASQLLTHYCLLHWRFQGHYCRQDRQPSLNRKFVITLFVCWSRILQKKKTLSYVLGIINRPVPAESLSSTSWKVAYDHQTCLAMLVPPLPRSLILETDLGNYISKLLACAHRLCCRHV
jgi:hypothetical protein